MSEELSEPRLKLARICGVSDKVVKDWVKKMKAELAEENNPIVNASVKILKELSKKEEQNGT